MKELEKMLDELKDMNERELESIDIDIDESELESVDMDEVEKRRIYDKTMEKIKLLEEESVSGKVKTVSIWSKRITKLVAGIVAVLLIGGTVAVASGVLNDKLKDYFFMGEDKKVEEANEMITDVNQTCTDKGISVKMIQVIGDDMGFVAVMEANTPQGMYEAFEFGKADIKVSGVDEKDKISWTEPSVYGGYDDKFVFIMKVKTPNISGKNISVTLKNLGYKDSEGKFVTHVKGEWKFNWKLNYKNMTKTYNINKNVSIKDTNAVWKKLKVSPLSVSVEYELDNSEEKSLTEEEKGKYAYTDRVVIKYKDGNRIDSRYSEHVQSYSEKGVGVVTIDHETIKKVSDIESVTFAGETYVVNKKSNPVKMKKFTSTVANFSVELREDVAKYVTMKEHKDTYSPYVDCKADFVEFTGHKDGCTMGFFDIYRIKGNYSEKYLEEEINPFMDRLGYRDGYTYTIIFTHDEEGDNVEIFKDMFNDYVVKVENSFEYLQ